MTTEVAPRILSTVHHNGFTIERHPRNVLHITRTDHHREPTATEAADLAAWYWRVVGLKTGQPNAGDDPPTPTTFAPGEASDR